ncbi:DNA helicase [Edwardsiella phage vB_EpM_ZHS]|jgi:hypothetical protein|nr:DNA helicase [Edwardsiella phage vB_EpM_ZHS]
MKTFTFSLKCPRCWGAALFADAIPNVGEVVQTRMFYDRHGAPPVPGPNNEALCPLCGGYLRFDDGYIRRTEEQERKELAAHAH